MASTTAGTGLDLVRAIAEADPDPECRQLATNLLAVLPARAAKAGGTSKKVAAELAETVRARFRLRTGFPADLGVLTGLSDDDGRVLLTDLLAATLAPPGGGDTFERRTVRLERVVRAVRCTGAGRRRRMIRAGFPAALSAAFRVALWTADRGERVRLGALLGLVEPADAVGIVEPVLRAPDANVRAHALRTLIGIEGSLDGLSPRALRPNGSRRLSPFDIAFAGGQVDRSAGTGRIDQLVSDLLRLAPPETASLDRAADLVEPAGAAATRPAYARLDAPDVVILGATFELRVGLAELPASAVLQDAPFQVPVAAFTLTVRVIAPGFRLLGGSGWERTIEVTPDDPFSYDVLRLVALDGYARARSIVAEFAVDSRTLGFATRVVEVTDAVAAPGEQATTPAEPGGIWVLPGDEEDRPDLEIVVARGNDVSGAELSWLCRTKHTNVALPSGAFETVLPGSAEFVRQAIRGIEERVASPDLPEYLQEISRMIGAAVPAPIWAALAAVAERAGGPPTVLLASWEPYLPWELARVPQPWDEAAPEILGAQAVVGRWTYSATLRTAGPPTSITVDSLTVVTGDYSGTLALPEAEAEAATLRTRYGAATVDALVRPILDCIEGAPPTDALHVALHGSSTSTGTNDGFLMRDKTFLSPVSVRGAAGLLGGRPSPVRLAFLNACQVGQGRQLLGEYTGMAPAFLGVGVGAVVAPLWQVDDVVARAVAEAFYAAVLAPRDALAGGSDPVSPAVQLRRERASTKGHWDSPGGTRLAYLFFGHPCLRVVHTRTETETETSANEEEP